MISKFSLESKLPATQGKIRNQASSAANTITRVFTGTNS
jgi:hypothetical protein